MRFRLFKPARAHLWQALCLGSMASMALGAGCSGEPFTSGSTPAAGGNGGASAGAPTTGGEPGNEAGDSGGEVAGAAGVPSGGSGGEMPSGGSAGKPPVGCDCAAAEYCQDGANKCRKCSDFTRFQFGARQPLTMLAQSSQSERFARSAGVGSALFYVTGAADNSKILYTTTPISSVGTPVSSPGQVESAPLFVSGFADQNLFFDRREAGARKLRMAFWTAPAVLIKDVLVPEPINAPGFEDYSIAISPSTGHVYWMSTRNGQAELLWQPTSMSAPPAPAVLDLKVKAGSTQCARSGDDATPWVNVAGTLLLFRNPSLDEDCKPNDSGATDLFAAPLDKDGLALATAIPLSSLNVTGGSSFETDPSLSNDACTLYFASDNGTGNFDLYKAPRN